MSAIPLPNPLVLTLERHYDDLVAHVSRRFRERDADRGFAREVVHDLCIDLIQRPCAEPVQTPLAWLRTASIHRAIDRCRADTTRLALVEPMADPPDTAFDEHDGSAALAFRQHLHALAAIIEQLPPRARQVFLLHRIHGMPQQAIADAIGISRNMVTQHYQRAMAGIVGEWAPMQP